MKQRYLTDELLNKLDKLVLGAVGNPQLLPDNWDYDQVLSLIENLASTFLTPSEIEASLSIQDGEPVPRESREIKNHRLLSLYSGLRQKYFENKQAQEQDINNAKKDIIQQAYEASLAEENRLAEIEAEIGKKGLNKEFELAQQKISQIRAKYNIKTDGSNVLALQATLDPQEAFPSTARILQQDQHGIVTPSLQTFEVLDDLAGLAASLETHPYIATIKYKVNEASPQELDSDQSNFLVAAIASGISTKNSSLSRKILERTGVSLDDAQSKPLPITNDTVISLSNLLEEDSTLAVQQQAVEYLQQQSGLSKEESAKTISTIAQEINIAKETQEVSDADIFTPLITTSPQVPLGPNELQQVAPTELLEKAAEVYLFEQTLKTQLPQTQYEKVTKALVDIGPNEFDTSNTNLGSFLTNQNVDPARITQIVEDFQTRKLQAATPNAYTSPIESIQTVLKNGHQPNSQEVVSILTTLGYTPDQIKNITTELTNSTSPQSELKSTLAKQTTLNNTAISQVAANTALKTLPEDSQVQFQTELNSLTTPPDTVAILKISKKLNIPIDQQTKFLTEYDQAQTSLLQESLQQQVLQHTAKTASQSPAELQDQLKNLGLKPDQIEIAVKSLKNLPTNQPAQAISTTKEIVESVSSVSVNYTSAYEAISATLPENKKQLALSDLSQLDKHSITEVSVAAILAKHATNPNQITQGLESYSQNQNLILQKVASTTGSIDQSLTKPLIKIYSNATSPEDAIKQATALILENTKNTEVLAAAQAESSYQAYKDTIIPNPQLISQKLQSNLNTLEQAARSGSVGVAVESVTNQLSGLTPELSTKSRQELAREIVNSSRAGQDINQTVISFISTATERSEAAAISKTNIITFPGPITHSDRVLFATNIALQASAINLEPSLVKEIAQAHASLNPQLAHEKTLEIIAKSSQTFSTPADQIATRISTNINVQLNQPNTQKVVTTVLENNKLTLDQKTVEELIKTLDDNGLSSISKSQKINALLQGKTDKISPQIMTSHLTTAHTTVSTSSPLNSSLKSEIDRINQDRTIDRPEKILQTRAAYSSKLTSPLSADQTRVIKNIANNPTLSAEEKGAQLSAKFQEFGLSPSASQYLSNRLSTPKTLPTQQIIRTALEPKSPEKLVNILITTPTFTKKDLLVGSLSSAGLSQVTINKLLPDMPSIQTLLGSLPANERPQVFSELILKKYDPRFSPNPQQLTQLNQSLNVMTKTTLNPKFTEDLLFNFQQLSPNAQKSIGMLFNNKQTQIAALEQVFGSKTLARAFAADNLHIATFRLAQGATLNSRDPLTFHLDNSLQISLKYLESRTTKDSKLWKEIQAFKQRLPDNLLPIQNTLNAISLSPAVNRSAGFIEQGKITGLFKFITQPKNFFNTITKTAINENLVKTVNAAFSSEGFVARIFPAPVRPIAMAAIKYYIGNKLVNSELGYKLGLQTLAKNLNVTFPTKFRAFGVFSTFDFRNPVRSFRVAARTTRSYLKFGLAQNPTTIRGKAAIGKIAASSLGKIASQIAVKTGIKGAISTITSALGSFAPIIGNIIGFIVGWIIGEVVFKVIDKVIKPFLENTRNVILFSVGALGTASTVGLAGLGTSISTTIGAIVTLTGAFVGAIVTAILGPVLITVIVVPVTLALFLFITTNSSYVVPPTQYTFGSPTAPDGSAVILPPDPTGDNPRCWPFRSQDANRLFISQGPSGAHFNSIDIASGEQNGQTGTVPVFATHNGQVEIRPFDPSGRNGGYGIHILLHGNGGFYTIYAHLHRTSVPNGSVVGRGTLLGYLGNTGNSTGAHLHYQMAPNPPSTNNISSIVPPYTVGGRPNGGFAGDPGNCGTITRPSIAPSLPPQTP